MELFGTAVYGSVLDMTEFPDLRIPGQGFTTVNKQNTNIYTNINNESFGIKYLFYLHFKKVELEL